MRTLVIFTEEMSAKVMLESLLPRLLPEGTPLVCIPFEGKQDLEKQLPIKLKGWRRPDTEFVVLRDQDSGDCRDIKNDLVELCSKAGKPNALVRIACRELESWYFGDLEAVEAGLGIDGLVPLQGRARYRQPDSIHAPARELKQVTRNSYQKVRGSRLIGRHLRLDNTRSRSFMNFIEGVCKVMQVDLP